MPYGAPGLNITLVPCFGPPPAQHTIHGGAQSRAIPVPPRLHHRVSYPHCCSFPARASLLVHLAYLRGKQLACLHAKPADAARLPVRAASLVVRARRAGYRSAPACARLPVLRACQRGEPASVASLPCAGLPAKRACLSVRRACRRSEPACAGLPVQQVCPCGEPVSAASLPVREASLPCAGLPAKRACLSERRACRCSEPALRGPACAAGLPVLAASLPSQRACLSVRRACRRSEPACPCGEPAVAASLPARACLRSEPACPCGELALREPALHGPACEASLPVRAASLPAQLACLSMRRAGTGTAQQQSDSRWHYGVPVTLESMVLVALAITGVTGTNDGTIVAGAQ